MPHPRFLPLRPRGDGRGERRPRRLAPHRREPLGAIGDGSLEAKTRLGPPGVDIDAFSPLAGRRRPRAGARARSPASSRAVARRQRRLLRPRPARRPQALRRYAEAAGPAGRLRRQADRLEGRATCCSPPGRWSHARTRARGCCSSASARTATGCDGSGRRSAPATSTTPARSPQLGWALEGGEEAPLTHPQRVPRAIRRRTAVAAAAPRAGTRRASPAGSSTTRSPSVLAASDAMVVPSTFPEAFGMVAAEAAAAGALPVCADHSGLAEVAAALAAELPPDRPAASPPSRSAPDAVEAIAERLNAWLASRAAASGPRRRCVRGHGRATLELGRGRALGPRRLRRRSRGLVPIPPADWPQD